MVLFNVALSHVCFFLSIASSMIKMCIPQRVSKTHTMLPLPAETLPLKQLPLSIIDKVQIPLHFKRTDEGLLYKAVV